MTLREALSLWFALLVLLAFLAWASVALCWDCGGACGDSLDCLSGCECLFPEDDDNHHYGRCG